jgi:hypothetical protein
MRTRSGLLVSDSDISEVNVAFEGGGMANATIVEQL